MGGGPVTFGRWLKEHLVGHASPGGGPAGPSPLDVLLATYWAVFRECADPEVQLFARYLAAYLWHHDRTDPPRQGEPPCYTQLARFFLFSQLILPTDWLIDAVCNPRLRDGDPYIQQCVYHLPSWTQKLSVLTVVTPTVLEPWEDYHLRTISDRLFSMAWTQDSDRKHLQEQGRILNEARRASSAAIIAHNGSHNSGSHVPANVSPGECRRQPQDVKMLLSYIQQRLDFVASVMAPWPDWREPVFFFANLLSGLFDQGLLWDKIVADEGYKARKINVRVTWMGGVPRVWNYRPAKSQRTRLFSRFEPAGAAEPAAAVADFLVGIPGGVMGRQAFYGLLENLIRNSAKHNPWATRAGWSSGSTCDRRWGPPSRSSTATT